MAMLPDALGALLGAPLGSHLCVRRNERVASLLGGVVQAVGIFGVGWAMGLACVDGDSAEWGGAADATTANGSSREGGEGAEDEEGLGLCSEVSVAALVAGLACNAVLGLGLQCNRIGTLTYALKARPHARYERPDHPSAPSCTYSPLVFVLCLLLPFCLADHRIFSLTLFAVPSGRASRDRRGSCR